MAKTVVHDELNAKWGEKDHLQVSQQKTFTSMIFETLSEKEAGSKEQELLDLILNLSIDHGSETPSAGPVISAAKEGKTISEAISLGVLEINDSHGGAIEPLMEILSS
jgi:citrate synthase